MSLSPIRVLVLWISRRALRWCFREVRFIGLERVPESGATMLFGTHHNDLPDVLAGYFTTSRPVRYVATIASVTRPLAGATYSGMGVIPVTRVRDARKMRALGVDVSNVNSEAFSAVTEAFRNGDVVGVFPEGGVQDSSSIARPKAGVAKMALSSIDDELIGDIAMLPFALHYEAPHVPRSDVAVLVGQPFSLREWSDHHLLDRQTALSARLFGELEAIARTAEDWHQATARDRLTASLAALLATAEVPLLETAVALQKRCGTLVASDSQANDTNIVRWRTIADEMAAAVSAAGGISTSARDTARLLDGVGLSNPQAQWPTLWWVIVTAMPAGVGLASSGPFQFGAWVLARRTAKVPTDLMARAIVPGLHLIFLGYALEGGLLALALPAAGVSAWWALVAMVSMPRLGDLGLKWLDALRALQFRARVRALPESQRTAIRHAAERLRSAWVSANTSSSSSPS